ncbi:MAG TPA: adenylate/guanylate cyclase domain-containing protein [Candidatus Dormibacteraeota bacterium]|nr:adenylate/guanylate cyclase domain-containing protein [Candidatus Dormibacteraeota bacterium]
MTLPTGTVTFLFTDIEGSTRLMQEVGDRYVKAQSDHHDILRAAFTGRRGRELRTEGDSFFAVFESAVDACGAAATAQRDFESHQWPEGVTLRVRVGVHTGEAPLVGNEYIGLDVHHAARVAASAHGGQVVVSETTRALVEEHLPEGLSLRDLGTHRLKDLARPERLYQLVITGARDQFPPLRTLDSTPNNLPTQLTSFIGRDQDVAEAKRLLAGTRLLTLTGPGGIGKTRLSLQLAADVVQDFRDGVFFVPLSAVNDPALIASVIVNTLGASVSGNRMPLDVANEYLRDKRVLLLLDNYEQLLPDGASVVSDLLHGSPGLKVVVSSRAVLRVYGEQEMAVQPLRLPDLRALPPLAVLSQYEAVKLFIERAVAVKPDFEVTNENAPAVAGICERVDGLPLAIELAAARVKLFAPQALLTRLEKSLQVLVAGSRDLPGRQQTLAGAIAWSYNLLDEAHRRLFQRFSVFARGANLEQAEAVCGSDDLGVDVLTALDELADQSLLRRLPDFEEPRLLMLQVVREYAAERLEQSGEAAAIKDRHAAAYQALAEAAASHLFGPDRKEWLDLLERDHDNFRAAFDWALANGDASRAMCLGAAFWRFWQMRGHLREGRARMEAVLAMSTPPTDQRARALEAAAGIAYWQADMQAAQRWYDENLAIVRASGDRRKLADALYNTSFPKLVGKTDLVNALGMVEEALTIFQELGDAAGAARSQWSIGNALYFEGRNPEAAAALDEAIELNRKLDNRFGLGWALHTRALAAIKLDDVDRARACTRQAMEIFCEAQDLSGMTILLDDAASVAEFSGDLPVALKLAAAALVSRKRTGTDLAGLAGLNDGRDWHTSVTSAEEETAWREGTEITVQDATSYALDWLASATPPAPA